LRIKTYVSCRRHDCIIQIENRVSGADPEFQVRGGALKKIAPSGGRRENFWGISCEKSRPWGFTFELEDGRVVIEGFVNKINNKLCVVPKARTLRIKK
jgi:hypothetical protein